MYSKDTLKDVFSGISSVLFQKTPIALDFEEFDSTKAYAKDDIVKHNGSYYKAKAAVTAGTWNASDWDALTALPVTLAPEYDLPVHVDDLGLNEGEPSVNHYKVFGLDTDWTATVEKGDFDISLLIPTLHEEVLKLAYGEDAVTALTATLAANSGAGAADTNWTGIGVELGTHEVNGSLILLNQAKDRLLIMSNVALWASLAYENGSTDPVGIRLNGTITANENTPDVMYFKKNVA